MKEPMPDDDDDTNWLEAIIVKKCSDVENYIN